jgi:hypothetical protein
VLAATPHSVRLDLRVALHTSLRCGGLIDLFPILYLGLIASASNMVAPFPWQLSHDTEAVLHFAVNGLCEPCCYLITQRTLAAVPATLLPLPIAPSRSHHPRFVQPWFLARRKETVKNHCQRQNNSRLLTISRHWFVLSP